jgi:hypothetical protein
VATADAILDLLSPDLAVEIDLARLTATFHSGPARVTVRGECARVLHVYLRARRSEVPAGGWLTPQEAWSEWVAAGGSAASPKERLGWERGKLRSQLSRLHVANVDALFEISREGDTIRTRVGRAPREL